MQHPAPRVVPAPAQQDRNGVFACFSNIERNGHWSLPRLFRTLSVFGSVELDLHEVELGPESDIEIVTCMGNVEIRVPPSVRLECVGEATIGNFEVHRETASTTSPEAPLVRIRAKAFLGNIEITVVDPHKQTFLQKVRARWKWRDTDPD